MIPNLMRTPVESELTQNTALSKGQ
jgi:hypothetical protein